MKAKVYKPGEESQIFDDEPNHHLLHIQGGNTTLLNHLLKYQFNFEFPHYDYRTPVHTALLFKNCIPFLREMIEKRRFDVTKNILR